MKTYISLFLLAITLFTSCSKGDNIEESNKEEETYLSASELTGVWVNDNNNLYFISFTNSGRYSFCLNDQLMGAGKYKLEKNQLILDNEYLYTSDVIKVSKQNNKLILSGDLTLFKEEKTKNIYLSLSKSQEATPTSVIGKKPCIMTGLNQFYNNLDIEFNYKTNYICEYIQSGTSRKTGKWKIIEEYTWFYVYRYPYTYTQEANGDGKVVIYDFENSCIVGGLDRNLIEQ